MRNFNDFDENFRFLMRSKTDKSIKKEFDLEVSRATSKFIHWYINCDSVETAMSKLTRSYGGIISQIVIINISNLIK